MNFQLTLASHATGQFEDVDLCVPQSIPIWPFIRHRHTDAAIESFPRTQEPTSNDPAIPLNVAPLISQVS